MRWIVLLLAMLAVGTVSAEEIRLNKNSVTGDKSTIVIKPVGKVRAPITEGVRDLSTGGVKELSDADCINLQCDLTVFTSCATRLGCKCKGTGVTICVDTIEPD
jgi:hypothetical protein